MIIRSSSFKEFILDTYLHAFFGLLVVSLIFILGEIKRYRKDLEEITKIVLEKINLTNYITKTDKVTDDSNLDNLSEIYTNSSFFSKELSDNIKLGIYTQLGVLLVTVLVVIFISEKGKNFWKNILFEKVIFFLILISLQYIFYETVVNEYQDIKHKDVFKIIKKNINDLN